MMSALPQRSTWYRLRALARWLQRGVLGLVDGPPEQLAPEARQWTTARFMGEDPDRMAQAAVAENAALVRRLFSDSVHWGGRILGAYDCLEACMLVHLVRRRRPTRIVEVAPNRGYSTALIQLGLAGRDDFQHRSYDIEDFEACVRETVARHGRLANWEFFLGDYKALVTEPEHRDFLAAADLVFVDADHSREFGEWYTHELGLFDLVAPGTLIHVHDVYPEGTAGRAEFPEADPVFAWLEANRGRAEVLFDYELGRSPALQAAAPPWLIRTHHGRFAQNPSLWVHRT